MSLEQYSKIILKHWRLVVICFVLVGAGAYIGSELMTPLYQSTAIVEVALRSGTTIDYDSLSASNLLVQTEATLATSDPVLREVASHYRGLSVGLLSTEVTATSVVNTQLFKIDVQDPSPTQAAVLANDIAVTLVNQQNQLMQQNIAAGGSFLVIAQSAQPTLSPVSPNKPLYTGAGLLTGLLLGILLALLFEQLDTRVRTQEALTQLLDWPILATIRQARPKEDLIHLEGRNVNTESYRILRTKIGYSAIDKPLRTLMITSATPRDGKSVVAANLAIFMARAGKKTLLVDADLRCPIQHKLFGIPADKMGFSNAILAFNMPTTPESLLDSFVYRADIPNLSVMPFGPLSPNPPELLDSVAMQRLFAALASCGAEIVIFDTPPVIGLSDATILASKVDGTLVVVDITRARKGSLKQVKDLLGQAGARVLGCVVNKQPRSRNDVIYSYHYNADKQNNKGNHRTNNVNSLAVLPTSPGASKESDLIGKEDSKNKSADNASSPATPAEILDSSNQQTIQLSKGRTSNVKMDDSGL